MFVIAIMIYSSLPMQAGSVVFTKDTWPLQELHRNLKCYKFSEHVDENCVVLNGWIGDILWKIDIFWLNWYVQFLQI